MSASVELSRCYLKFWSTVGLCENIYLTLYKCDCRLASLLSSDHLVPQIEKLSVKPAHHKMYLLKSTPPFSFNPWFGIIEEEKLMSCGAARPVFLTLYPPSFGSKVFTRFLKCHLLESVIQSNTSTTNVRVWKMNSTQWSKADRLPVSTSALSVPLLPCNFAVLKLSASLSPGTSLPVYWG